ncbi:LOW QUALITY PROTEIN: ATP-dependent translocase ABCB1-like [Condylostylus longicornis]|uniref:LOW QUALITY PROTEIN: ATP-dependent translocase ABCB1-like n=1 Tax=Condylostylus longicornis TaxID=2530218 RepID=UPI00244E3ECB|nr:LOW QUALITY PROTEIN: ATP-dependent translocase ABCB1-like [Condylostylus longicornis]
MRVQKVCTMQCEPDSRCRQGPVTQQLPREKRIESETPPPASRSSFAYLASLGGIESNIPSPEPVPINLKAVPDEADVTAERMKFNMGVFRFANGSDKALLILGIVMNLVNGCAMSSPIFSVVGIASFVVSAIGAAAIDLAAERQIREMRHHYLDAVMRQEMGWYEVHLDESRKQGVKGGLSMGFGLGLTLGVMFLSYSLGSRCEGDSCFRGGNALAVFFAVIIAAFSLGQAGPPLTSFLKAGASAEDLLALIDRKSKIDVYDKSGKTDVNIKGDVVFKNVHFHYPSRPEKQIFNGINLHIPAGKTVALVGGSGCGKSTIIQMVQRFYDPDEGEILIDGVAVKDYNTTWIRDQMSLVSQEPRLFARSIAENIRDGRLGATIDEVQSAAKNANAWSFISEFPEKFDTFVGEGGSQLSGGQKQRIAIARAMLRDPAILILDEATSALDNESEKVVQSTLDALVAARKRTTIVIAHRLTTIRNADLIIVLDNSNGNGAVVAEQGRHDELMAIPNGIYQNLVNAQKLQGVLETIPRTLTREESDMKNGIEKKLSTIYQKRSTSFKPVEEPAFTSIEKPSKKKSSGLKPPSYWRVMSLLKPYWFRVTIGVLVMQRGFMEWGGQDLVRTLRSLAFEKMLYQDMSFFDHPDHTTGTLSQILSSDVLLIKGWSGDNIGIIIQNVASMVAGVIIAFTANAKLAAVALAAFLVMIPASAARMKFMKGSTKEIEEGAEVIDCCDKSVSLISPQTAGYVINETITNIRIVTAYNLQAVGMSRPSLLIIPHLQRMLESYDAVLDQDYKDGKFNALIGQSMIFITDVKKAKEAGARIYEVIDREPLIDARSTIGKEFKDSEVQGAVTVSNINFRYPMRTDVPVFKKISFAVEPGQTVALVGGSGCGKSTVIQLLQRFYDVEVGMDSNKESSGLSVDGVDVRDVTVKSLRGVMGLVSQEPILFNTTIMENIRYGKPSASDDEVMAAAKMANAHNFVVEFPDSYNTIVGKFGGQLSGGQKQRIAIARAMIRNPKILLLDEATSALDAESEKIVQAALDQLLAESKRTTIVIAHRLSTIQNADKIVVLANPDREGSSVVEVGTHAELMGIRDGPYTVMERQKMTTEFRRYSNVGQSISVLADQTTVPASSWVCWACFFLVVV